MPYISNEKDMNKLREEIKRRGLIINNTMFTNQTTLKSFCNAVILDNKVDKNESFHKAIGMHDDKYIVAIIGNFIEISLSYVYLCDPELYKYKKNMFGLKEEVNHEKLKAEVGEDNIISCSSYRYNVIATEKPDNNRFLYSEDKLKNIKLCVKINDVWRDNNKNEIDKPTYTYVLLNVDDAFDEAFDKEKKFDTFQKCRMHLNKRQAELKGLKILRGGNVEPNESKPPYKFEW